MPSLQPIDPPPPRRVSDIERFARCLQAKVHQPAHHPSEVIDMNRTNPAAVVRRIARTIAIGAGVLALSGLAHGQALQKLVVFSQPLPLWDSLWMADAKGFYKEEGLDVQFRMFPSGTTSLQTFKLGEGDINMGGDLPGVNYWLGNNKDFRVVMVVERDSKGYVAASSKAVVKAQDLKGKTIATRVGSTGSYFISQYLKKNNLTPQDVTIKNLDSQVMPTALCQGDIDAFFIFQPFPARALEICPEKVHYLSTAEGYIPGYSIAAVRASWLEKPENVDKLAKFLRATIKGMSVAAKDFQSVAKYGKEKYDLSEQAVKQQWDINERIGAIDDIFYTDYCQMAGWMRTEGMLKEPLDFTLFVSGDALKKIDAKRFTTPPKAC
jgi:ABC-type nitrate/sulfonate/bicarbonate transport system substrate-binding protein